MERRELPTHLHVEDKLIAGLTVRQVLFLSVGVSVGYSLWLHLAWLAHVPALAHLATLEALLRFALAAVPVLAMAICILVRPAGRPLEDWLPVALRYAVLPKAGVWRSAYPSRGDEVLAAFSTLPSRLLRLDAEDEEFAGDWLDQRDDGEDGDDKRWVSEVEPISSSLEGGRTLAPLGTPITRSDRRAIGRRIGRPMGTQGSMRIAVRLAAGARSASRGSVAVTSPLAAVGMPAAGETSGGATPRPPDVNPNGGAR